MAWQVEPRHRSLLSERALPLQFLHARLNHHIIALRDPSLMWFDELFTAEVGRLPLGEILHARPVGCPPMGKLVRRTLEGDSTIVTMGDRQWTLDNPGLVSSLPTLHPLPDGSIVAIEFSPFRPPADPARTVMAGRRGRTRP